jgi:Flp pilus assembly protein TadB
MKPMNMKIASTKFFAALFLFTLAATPLRAQTNSPAEIRANNAVVAQTMTNNAPASNAVVAAKTEAQKPSEESSPVRIDNTGIHIRGENPVDINIPKSNLPAVLALLIPIFATLAPFVMIIAIVAIVFYFKHRRNKMIHEILRAMIEKGVPVTPELIAQLRNKPSKSFNQLVQQPSQSRNRGLLPGLVLTGIGTALLISHGFHGSIGWIILLIGVAFLIVWFVEGRDKNNGQPSKL